MNGTDAVTLWIAILGVALGASSLTWQVASFLLSAGRVKVSSQEMVMFNPLSGMKRPVMQVTVRNVGRMPVSVTGWTFMKGEKGFLVINPTPEFGPPLPHTIAPGHHESWRVGKEQLAEQLGNGEEGTVQLTPTVWLGTGKAKVGPRIALALGDHEEQ